MPNAIQSEIAVVNTVNLKITDKQYFATILANQILGGGEGRLFLNLREKHGWTYGSYSDIRFGKYVQKFSSTASVRTTQFCC
jgi:predicted Zn-dependent peptidase